jgi:hypothetical protein
MRHPHLRTEEFHVSTPKYVTRRAKTEPKCTWRGGMTSKLRRMPCHALALVDSLLWRFLPCPLVARRRGFLFLRRLRRHDHAAICAEKLTQRCGRMVRVSPSAPFPTAFEPANRIAWGERRHPHPCKNHKGCGTLKTVLPILRVRHPPSCGEPHDRARLLFCEGSFRHAFAHRKTRSPFSAFCLSSPRGSSRKERGTRSAGPTAADQQGRNGQRTASTAVFETSARHLQECIRSSGT